MGKLKGIRNFELVHIQWIDSASPTYTQWEKLSECKIESYICESVGYVAQRNSQYIQLFQTIRTPEKDWGIGFIEIPIVAIKEVNQIIIDYPEI